MKYQLRWSILASFEGINPGKWCPCENSPSDVQGHVPPGWQCYSHECSSLEELHEHPSKYDRELWTDAHWSDGDTVQFLTVSGIGDRKEVFDFLDSIGAYYEDCETLGTLGGPLGSLVPDFPFTTDGRLMVSSIRITPVLFKDGTPSALPSECWWGVLRTLLRTYDTFDLARQGRAVGKQHKHV